MLIQENICCYIDDFKVEILTNLGQFLDVYYFKVIIHNIEKMGLLRVGSIEGGLKRELQLREKLGEHKMISPLLGWYTLESVELSTSVIITETEEEIKEQQPPSENESEYLEEEFYEEINYDSSPDKLILLSEIPDTETTIKTWLTQSHPLEQSLLLASQVCQFFRTVYQYEWCFISLFPQFVKMNTPIQFFDLTSVYPVGEKLNIGLIGDYYPPELASGYSLSEQMSTYVVGTILYQAIHQKLPPSYDGFSQNYDLAIAPIPGIYQILNISLAPIPEERFHLSQLVNLLISLRKTLATPKVRWEIANRSTLGMAINRLENEDSYGIMYPCINNTDSFILAVVADGMGGMAQGEVASKTAVKSILDSRIPTDLINPVKRADWLISLVEKANEYVTKNVHNGGTTVSVALAVGKELNIAHVGDSRIFLLRNNTICQLSEDHSMVAMLLASGQISYEESINHPERNLLTKSLGSKPRLSPGYVQDLSLFGAELSVSLEDKDIIILCSDGVWDLVPSHELGDIFFNESSLQTAVDQTIAKILARGAHDNATIIALKCHLESPLL